MWYQYIKPNDAQVVKMQVFRDKFEELDKLIQENVDNSRGKSLCLTKLEEASFWLNKWITNND